MKPKHSSKSKTTYFFSFSNHTERMVLSDNWTATQWDLWIACGHNITLSCREFSQTLILPVLCKTTVFPKFLHFKKAIYCPVSPFQTHLISLLCLFILLHLIFIHAYVHITELFMPCFVFNTPSCKSKAARHKAVKTPLPFNSSHLGWRIYGQVIAPETEAERSLPRPSLKLGTLLLTHHLILSPFGHVRHRGVMPLTAPFDTHSSAPAQSPGATAWLFIFPPSQ